MLAQERAQLHPTAWGYKTKRLRAGYAKRHAEALTMHEIAADFANLPIF
jgi:hypothetical protein